MNIVLANIEQRERWDSFVNNHPDGSPYHQFAWKMAIEQAYGHKAYYLMAMDSSKVVGIMPMVHVKAPFQRGQMVALPFCDVGNVLCNDYDALKSLVQEAITIGERTGVRLIDLRGPIEENIFVDQHLSVQKQSNKVRMLFELPKPSEILWDSFKSKLRSQIRKAEKNGLSFTWDNGRIADFYQVFCENMRDLGSPVHSRKWFEAVLRHFGARAHLGLVYLGDKVVGGGILLSTDNKISVPWASTLREYNRRSPNMLLYWNLLKFSADNGFSIFDFGRSTQGEGTYKFKSQWGAQPEPLLWHYISLHGHQAAVSTGNSSTRKFVAKYWQQLPTPVANFLGSRLRRYISL